MSRAKKNGRHARKASQGAGPKRARNDSVRAEPVRDSTGTLEHARDFPPLVELIQTLRENKIRFQIAGMTGAILQGVPATTLDVDIWLDFPQLQYLYILGLCRKLGGAVLAPTVVALRDDSLINFLYSVDGLVSFSSEYRKAPVVSLFGNEIRVLSLESILKSKLAILRPKDLAHIPLIREVLKLKKRTGAK